MIYAMWNFTIGLMNNISLESLLALIIAVLAFYAIYTGLGMLLERREQGKRIDLITSEREALRQQYKQELQKQKTQGSLREKPRGILPQLVEALNLRQVFDAEVARKNLRRAGYRLERHLLIFLAIRLLAPFVFAFLAYVYYPFLFGEDLAPNKVLGVVLGGFMLGYFAPGIWLTNTIKKRQESIRLAWSDALDLMLICVESGQSLEQAINRVALEMSTQSRPLAEELQLTMAELNYLGDRRKGLENLAERTGLPNVKSVVTAMIQSERYGTPLGQALRSLAKENRNERMQMLEKKAYALPPKLTVPLVLFFLPVIFLVLLSPAAILAGFV